MKETMLIWVYGLPTGISCLAMAIIAVSEESPLVQRTAIMVLALCLLYFAIVCISIQFGFNPLRGVK